MATATKRRKANGGVAVRVRWAITRDLEGIVAVDLANDRAANRTALESEYRNRLTVPVVAVRGDDDVAGYAVLRHEGGACELVRLHTLPGEARAPQLLRDHFLERLTNGSRTRALVVTPVAAWITDTVRSLCRMKAPAGILADALDDAGCSWGWLLEGLRADAGDFLDCVLAQAVATGVRRRGAHYRIQLNLEDGDGGVRWVECDTLRECQRALMAFRDGGNNHGEHVGSSAFGAMCGCVYRASPDGANEYAARVSYNGRMWEPKPYPTAEEITDERLDAFAD